MSMDNVIQGKLVFLNPEKGYGFVEEYGTHDRYFIHVVGRKQMEQVKFGARFAPAQPSFVGMMLGCSVQILETDPDKPSDKQAAKAWIPSSEVVLCLYCVVSTSIWTETTEPVCDNVRKVWKESETIFSREKITFVGSLNDCRRAALPGDSIIPVGGSRRVVASELTDETLQLAGVV